MPAIRPALRIVEGLPSSDGAGVSLTRLLGQPRLQMLDPFLMLDFFGSDEPQDYLAGFPDHPHRGFQTVTYMLAGRMRHGDNKGNSGVIETGGVQWMHAGRGLVHSEMPEQTEGLMKGFQLWVNLPSHLKMSEPAYQEFAPDRIPVERRADGTTVKVIAGTTAQGTRGAIADVPSEARYFDVTLPAGAAFTESLPADHNAMLVVFEGAVTLADGTPMPALQLAALGAGEAVSLRAGPAGARLLLIAGRPIGEPVAWGGPFVMNTREEVVQAYRDFQEGRF
ncbi:MAG TPA: pirin family protein [Alphaproteobacteria bacterium]|nr:pirin family protein [Alphaproteobacteria bacterium]